jgi:hypothetical protein
VYVPAEHGFSGTGVVAEGEIDRPGWVYAQVDVERLRRLAETGEMRNAADWKLQPGAVALGQQVEVVSMCDHG